MIEAEQTRIQVSRGWPDTTTYLIYEDLIAHFVMRKEMETERTRADREKAKSQSNAF